MTTATEILILMLLLTLATEGYFFVRYLQGSRKPTPRKLTTVNLFNPYEHEEDSNYVN